MSDTPAAGQSTADLSYVEVLRPSIWIWLLAAAFSGGLGVAFGYAYGGASGWIVTAASMTVLGLMIGGFWRTRIEVGPSGFRADRAVLPGQWIGRVAPLDQQQAFQARTTKADARAHLVLRTWATNLAVIVEVTDPADPHPYWLVSTRRPAQLCAAVTALRDRQATDGRDPHDGTMATR